MQSKYLTFSFSISILIVAFARVRGMDVSPGVMVGFTIISYCFILEEFFNFGANRFPCLKYGEGAAIISALPMALIFGYKYNDSPVAPQFIDGLSLIALALTFLLLSLKK
ncbi:hypothetical protein [Fictibacillus sp. S7]|uniref:hypothetical protein n=1 Tax=Fictibacillus sp. S7 TaxID=2212476 RepID=UPI001012AE61|nr:hypothetical protein [Fictibacillus sp. S7]RXY98563.1 hypothetical protein DMO16_02150 [Fictibacillus sp. S7]